MRFAGGKRAFAGLLAAMLALAPAPLAAHGGGIIIIPIYEPMMVPPSLVGDYSKIHTVAVVSALGGSMTLQHLGFFDSHTRQMPIADWQIDSFTTTLLTQYLAQHFMVRAVTADRAAIAALPNGPLNNTKSEVAAELKRIPDQGIDAFIVVRPDLESNTPGVQGLFALTSGGLASDPKAHVGANYEIDVIDAHKMALIGKAYSRVRFGAGTQMSFAMRDAPYDALPDDGLPSDAQRTTLRAVTQALMKESLTETLRSLGLGLDLPGGWKRKLVPLTSQADPYRGLASAAVISVLGDQLVIAHDGNNETAAIQNWNADGAVEAAVGAAIHDRFAVKSATVDRAAMARASLIDKDGNFAPKFPGLPPSQDVDVYIVVMPSNASVWNGSASGIGIEHRAGSNGGDTGVFANYSIAVVNAHNLSVISYTQGFGGAGTAKPVAQVDNALWPASADQLSSDTAVKIRAAAMTLLTNSLNESVLHLALDGTAISEAPSY